MGYDCYVRSPRRVKHEKKIIDMMPGELAWAVPWAYHRVGEHECLHPSYSASPTAGGTVQMRVYRGRTSGEYWVIDQAGRVRKVELAAFECSPVPTAKTLDETIAEKAGLQPADVAWLRLHGWEPDTQGGAGMGAQITHPTTKKAVVSTARAGSVALLVLLLSLSTLPWYGAIGVALLVHAMQVLVGGVVANVESRRQLR
jgi:hypothetical protein